jgi:hypothetical protein
MDVWLNEWMDVGIMNGLFDGWMGEWIGGLIDWQMDTYIRYNLLLYEWKKWWMDDHEYTDTWIK